MSSKKLPIFECCMLMLSLECNRSSGSTRVFPRRPLIDLCRQLREIRICQCLDTDVICTIVRGEQIVRYSQSLGMLSKSAVLDYPTHNAGREVGLKPIDGAKMKSPQGPLEHPSHPGQATYRSSIYHNASCPNRTSKAHLFCWSSSFGAMRRSKRCGMQAICCL